MARKFYIKRTDSVLPVSIRTDLTGATVRCTVHKVGFPETPTDLDFDIVDLTSGDIDVDVESLTVAVWNFEIEVIDAAGRRTHFPRRGFDQIIVGQDMDGGATP